MHVLTKSSSTTNGHEFTRIGTEKEVSLQATNVQAAPEAPSTNSQHPEKRQTPKKRRNGPSPLPSPLRKGRGRAEAGTAIQPHPTLSWEERDMTQASCAPLLELLAT